MLHTIKTQITKSGLLTPQGLFLIALAFLVQEFLSQGYFFKPSDIIAPRLTHEKWALAAFVASLLFQYKSMRVRRRKRDERLSQKV